MFLLYLFYSVINENAVGIPKKAFYRQSRKENFIEGFFVI